jgi:hypothetical protein
MTSFDMDIKGLEEHQRELREERDRWDKPSGTWHVGTAVEYSLFLEFGTSKMDPKPFFRPALLEAQKDLSEFVRKNTRKTLQEVDGPQELVKTIAFALERRVKEIITEKGLIDTGTLRASVQAVPTSADDLPTADEVDPTAGADVEVTA